MSRALHFQLTINKEVLTYYEEIKDYLLNKKDASYFISSIEENEQENLHIHIYVQFKERTTLNAKKLYGAHIELCKGDSTSNIYYVEKMKELYKTENVLDEIGESRYIKGRFGNNKGNLAADLQGVPFDEVPASQYRIWKDVNSDRSYRMKELYKPDIEVTYIWGKSGEGKSKLVYELIGEDNYADRVSFDGSFWDGVDTVHPNDICWYDDFRPSDMKPSEFIKFIDYYKNPMNMKYVRGWKNQYKKIFITSIFSPREIYQNIPEEAKEQWIRRMNIIHKDSLN